MILDEIVKRKRERLKEVKIKNPLSDLKEKVRDLPETKDFKEAIKREKGEPIRLIAEIKKSSPSKGIIRDDLDPEEIANIYEEKGASAISVLTEEDFFKGSLSDLQEVRGKVKLPLLRKDFIFDPYQVYESRLNGADAILLISTILERAQIEDLRGLAEELRMDSLVEVHNLKDLDKALSAGAEIIGINNRNLDTLKVDIDTTFKLIKDIPEDKIVVSESGIKEREDVKRIGGERVDAILVGTALMEAPNIGKKVEELMKNPKS
jgi:indole-3-glycerol phosphate synthase